MRKQFLLMMILCLTASMVWAERIDVATARKVAGSVAQREGVTSGLRSASDLSLVYAAAPGQSGSALRSGVMEGSADYFVFNFPGEKGFAIVAGDDRVRPVLGYSDEGSFDPDNLPENLRGMLAYYQDQITWANDKGIEATPDIAAEWSRLMSGTALRAAGEPVLLRTANWGQGEPYNRQTPILSDGNHAVTGCVATAMGIVMRYHEYPEVVTGNNRVTSYWGLPVNYATYEWKTKMPLDYVRGEYSDEEANAVSALMWNIGANVEMEYNLNASGAITALAIPKLNTVFGYSDETQFIWKEHYRWTEWKQIVRNELDNDRPVIYSGQNSVGGHAFICDGYKDNEAFHINWGWGGVSNGYFLLTALDDTGGDDFYVLSGMGIGIRPPEAGDTKPHLLKYRSLGCDQVKVGENFFISVQCHNIGAESITAKIDMAVIAVDGTIKKRIGTDNPLKEVSVNVNYLSNVSVLVNLSEALGDGEVILPVYSEDGSNWKVMKGVVDAPLYITMEGVQTGADDPGDPTTRPMNVGINSNEFDRYYLKVSGLDNNDYNSWNTKKIYYTMINVTEDIILRYTLKDYAAWTNRLAIYTGDDYITGPNEGTKVEVGATDASFEIAVQPGQIEDGEYVHYLKILSDKVGELVYDVRAYVASDRTTPIFEGLGNKIIFVNQAQGSLDKNPIRGAVNQEIPFAVKWSKVDDLLLGKDLSVSIFINGASEGQIQLFDANGDEIEMIAYSNAPTNLYSQKDISLGKLGADTFYAFKLKSSVMFDENNAPTISMTPVVAGKSVSTTFTYTPILIDPTTVKTYTVTLNSSDLKFADYAQTVIAEGKPFSHPLICEKVGYRLPASIKVTMGGTGLVAGTGYTYNRTDGWINIPAVTGDVVITANAELIPTATHTISIGQLDHLTASGLTGNVSVKEGMEFKTTFTPEIGYLLPTSIRIEKENGEVLDDSYYKYVCVKDRKSAELVILSVTESLKIYAIADPEPKSFSITGKLTHLTADKDIVKGVSIKENEPFEFTLKPATDYRLPEAIMILDGETPLVADGDYTYDKTSGKVVIFKVTSDLVIKATAIDNHQIQVVFNLEGVIATPNEVGPFTINTTPVFEVTFAAAEGYEYNGEIEVRMGDKLLSTPADYEYVPENDLSFTLKTPLSATLTITAKGTQKSYSVTTAYTNISTPAEELPKNVLHGNALSFKITPDEGYDLPETIEVKVGDKTLAAATDYTYNKATGEVSIVKVTGEVVITAVAVLKTYEVKLNLTYLTSDFVSGTKVAHGEPLAITLTPHAGYELPQAVIVLMNGKPAEHTYQNGKISIAKVLGLTEITAKANKLHPVMENEEHVTIEGAENIAQGETFIATVKPNSGYHLPYAISVIMNGRQLHADEYTYDRSTGKIEVKNVTGPLSISVKGVQEGYFEVVLNLANLTSSPASFEPQTKDTKIELTLKPSSGYELPGSVTVKMGNAALAAGTDYAYDRSTGKFTLERITGTLVITANGSRIPEPEPEPEPTPTTYAVTLPVVEGATISASGSTTVTEGSSFSFTVEVKAGYNADNMVVKANGTTLTADSNGRYTIANIRSNVVVTVTGIVKGDDPTTNEEIEAGELRVWASGSRLFIRTPEAERAYVVTFDGRVYKTLSLSAGEYSEQMPQGSYIIQIGKQSYKLNF